MKEVYRRCCGMDVHKETVVVCVLPPDGREGAPVKKVYGTFRSELIRMRVWLKQLKVTEIAMESTGVYWRPIWNVLEEQGFERLLLVNPVQVKALKGRKSDGRDCQRIAEFLQDQRLDASFVPPPEIRELRQLLRHRLNLLHERNRIHNRIGDLFETAGVKLASVVSDLLGLSGRRIIEAMIAGEESPERLSWRLRGSLRKKEKQVKESLKGCFNAFHRTMLESLYSQYQFLSDQVATFETRIDEHMKPHAGKVALLCGIPGVDRIVAWSLIAELGVDMSVFPSADHCASWAGLVPGDNESAGKQLSTRCRKGNKFIRRVLAQAAWAASHTKRSYLCALFARLKLRRGWSRALVAVAHKILIFAFKVLETGQPYQDLGNDFFDQINPARTTRRLLNRLERLGWQVQLSPSAPEA
jgi:transposase